MGYMTEPEAAEYIGATEAELARLTRLWRIPHVRLGRMRRYTSVELDGWLADTAGLRRAAFKPDAEAIEGVTDEALLAMSQDEMLATFARMRAGTLAAMHAADRAENLLVEARSKLRAEVALREERERDGWRLVESEADRVAPDRLPVTGYFVYVLRNREGEVVYVGQSMNVMARLAAHVTGEKRDHVDTVQLLPCATKRDMDELERVLIGRHRPRFNTVYIRGAA